MDARFTPPRWKSLLESAIPESQRVTLDAQSLALLRAETLAQLIDRRLVEAVLIGSSGAPSAKDVDAAIENTQAAAGESA